MPGLLFFQSDKVRSEPDISRTLEPFWTSLSTTITWCLPRIDADLPATCLRSSGSRPRLFTTSHLDAVREALQHRYPSPTPTFAAGDLRGGRLLIYFPDQELADGAAEVESRGFFDVNNAPPWDTWVAFIHHDKSGLSHLVSWVPPEFLSLADAGIEVNPEECILWLDDADVELKKRLAAASLPPGDECRPTSR
jgi:hypothetical protein